MHDPISFPGLGIELNIDRIAFKLFGQNIYWYGILIAAGFLIAAVYCLRRSRKMGLDSDRLFDALMFAVPAAIVGARLYYVVFNPSVFDPGNPNAQKFYEIWRGGLAIYGAVIFGLLTAALYARARKIRVGSLLDVGVLGLMIGQVVGRFGNLINHEAYGTATTLPWRMGIWVSEYEGTVLGAPQWLELHPTFLYEALWNVLGFVLLHLYVKKRKFFGEIFLMYIGWYGLGRGFIEGLRTDSLMLFGTGLRVSQLLGFLSFLLAAGLLVYLHFFYKKPLLRPIFGEIPPPLETVSTHADPVRTEKPARDTAPQKESEEKPERDTQPEVSSGQAAVSETEPKKDADEEES